MPETGFLELWNEFADTVLRGDRCRLCREQLEVARDAQELNGPLESI